MKTVTLYGYHGHSNLGDDMFLRSTLKWLSSEFGTDKVYLNAVKGVVPDNVDGVSVVSFDRLNHFIARLQWIRVLFYALKSDALVLSSGSILKIQPFSLIYFVLLLLRILKGRSFQILGLGVSLGPFDSNKSASWCAKIIPMFDRLLLRDERSVEWVRNSYPTYFSSGIVKLSCDLALLWNINKEPLKKVGVNVLGVAINADLFGEDEVNSKVGWVDGLVSVISDWALKDANRVVRFVIVCADPKDGDFEISAQFKNLLLARNVVCDSYIHRSLEVDETVSVLSGCDLVFASRMHAGILSIMSGVPVLQYSYAQKIADYFKDMGLPNDLLCMSRSELPKRLKEFLNEDQMWRVGCKDILLNRRLGLLNDFKDLESYVANKR